MQQLEQNLEGIDKKLDQKKMSMVSGKTVDIQKMLRSKPAEEEFDAVRRIFRRKAR